MVGAAKLRAAGTPVWDTQKRRDGVVVSVGTFPELVRLREQILESAGYTVISTTTAEEALRAIESGGCGVLLLCYSLPDDGCRELIRKFRQLCPGGRVVRITNYPVTQPAKDADELVYGIEGPEALIRAVQPPSA